MGINENIKARLSRGGRAIVLGFGVSNRPLARLLLQMGARLEIRDGKSREALGDELCELTERGATAVLGCDPTVGLCTEGIGEAVIFRSPGIRPDAGELPLALRLGAYMTSETEWFADITEAELICITGSDGKTTTTTLTHLMLSRELGGDRVYVGGNIGTPLLDRADKMRPGGYAVMELSSFQLQTMRGPGRRAAITNITPNHLNWHTDMSEYAEAKYNVFGDDTELLVLNAENELSRAAAERFGGRVIFFSSKRSDYGELCGGRGQTEAIFLRDGRMIYSDGHGETVIMDDISEIKLPGLHNVENYMCAAALIWGLVSKETVCEIAREFGGVEHRLEFVRELDGVKYYNSSIDSSPARTRAALSAISKPTVAICGGRDKHVPFAPLAEALAQSARAVVLTGEAAGQIYAAIGEYRAEHECKLTVVLEDDFFRAIDAARKLACPGDTLLLSPACTSFDRFSNFEERGRAFKEYVNSL